MAYAYSFFPALADHKRYEHFAASRFVGDVAHDVDTKGIEFHFTKT